MRRRWARATTRTVLALLALLATGLTACGDSTKTVTVPAPQGGGQQTSPALASARQACIDGANQIPNETARAKVRKTCDQIAGDAQQARQSGLEKARKACTDGANRIPDEAARQSALQACRGIGP
jgi:hypothetical protein